MAHILVVEDDADSREILSEFLVRTGHTVAGVPNGRAALEEVLSNTPDLVVLDLSLPELDGAKFLEILRSYLRLQSLPVVVWTGMIGSPIVDKAMKFHVDAVIAKGKPDFVELLSAIGRSVQPN